MGTNFYAYRKTDRPCPHCLGTGIEHVKTHIGKSSGGWTFSFHAPREWDLYPNTSAPADYKPIRSFMGWLKYLKDSSVRIFDEYGEEFSLHQFVDKVRAKMSEQMNHTRYMREDPRYAGTSHERECFLDEDGHSFSEGEFS